jgi:hypothetical protein
VSVSHLFLKGTTGWREWLVQNVVSNKVTKIAIQGRDVLGRKGISPTRSC